MNKLVSSFVIACLLCAFVDAIFAGGGFAATQLTNPVSITDTTFTVADTTGFLSAGVLYIDNERVTNTGRGATTFTGISRGTDNTTISSHTIGTVVYTEEVGIMDTALGFDAVTLQISNGIVSLITIPWNFFAVTLPRLLLWNFGFFTGDLLIVRYFLMGISLSFYIAFALQLLGVIPR